jgi:nicotinate-nucleotide adenylyltransferase
MNICLFGGTFDPIHRGHLEAARRAARKYKLHRVEFVVSDVPPHKFRQHITPYLHRYAMVALALTGEKIFFPSTLEAPQESANNSRFRYSIETVRRVKQRLKKSDRLFFLIGIDAFADIATWREPEALLRECEFIVVSRPGYRLTDVGRALPLPLQPSPSVLKDLEKAKTGRLVHAGISIHLLDGVRVPISASEIRKTLAQGRRIDRFVPARVAEYIKKMKLYTQESSGVEATIKLEN